ncbi:MAG: IPTL-CTERM sorting domain-containing protein [Burkholderiales bacterium]|nr:IPTL-CTERM sorting domain-containing protein [Burkholderiales bacterium]
MRLVRVLLLSLGVLLGWGSASAQTAVNHPHNTGLATYTLNSGPGTAWFNYYDSGGPGGNYADNANRTTSVVTFMSAPGTTIDVAFGAFQVEAGWDGLFIYDGASTAAPQIGSGNAFPPACGGTAGAWWGNGLPGNAGPGLVRSTGNAITFAFCSDASVTGFGWTAQVRTTEAIVLTKTVGTTPGVCAATNSLSVDTGTTVYYCYTATNSGSTTLNTHGLVDDALGTIFSGLSHSLAPGASIDTVTLGISVPAVIASTITNTATWTSGSLSASASATVTVPSYNVSAAVSDPAAGSAVCAPPTVLSGAGSTCTATANPGYVFTGWSGDCTGTNPVCTLSAIRRDMASTANFLPAYNVTASVNNPAGGSAVCVPAVVAAGGGSTCTATANPGYVFTGWSGACSGTNAVCTLSGIAAHQAVTASFAPATVQPVPTLEAWGLMLLSGLLGWLAYPRRRRGG